jgi:hypothetical protein
VLGLRPGTNRAEVTEAFRVYALRHHPDRGGDPATFQAGLEAYRQLLAAGAPGRRRPDTSAEIVFHRRPTAGVRSLLRVARRRLSTSVLRP